MTPAERRAERFNARVRDIDTGKESLLHSIDSLGATALAIKRQRDELALCLERIMAAIEFVENEECPSIPILMQDEKERAYRALEAAKVGRP